MTDNVGGTSNPRTLESNEVPRSSDVGQDQEGKNPRLGSTLRDPSLSLLRDWLTEITIKNPDFDKKRVKRWKNMGWEVFERKALLLAAARDLEENQIHNAMKLAATDIFVEKAQRILAFRGILMYVVGGIISALVVGVLGYAAWHVFHADAVKLLQVSKSSDTVSNAYLTVLIFKATTTGAFVVAIAYFLVSLSRALLHEATVLYSRRHSLRFGRLFVYLMSGTMTREDLVAVFNWNAEFSTAFKDIQAENITKSPLVKLLETPGETLKYLSEMQKSYFENMAKERERKDAQKHVDGGP